MKVTATLTAALCAFGFIGCGGEKNISVIIREASSGTREAFEKVVTDGENWLNKDAEGNSADNNTKSANVQSKTAAVIDSVKNDKNAIGYISLGSVDSSSMKVVKVNGVEPSTETVLSGEYEIQRPFVIMSNSEVQLNARAQDFMNYLRSSEMSTHAQTAGCVFLEDETKRANEGESAIPVTSFEKQDSLPGSGKIIVKGSTSMEKIVKEAAIAYAALYNVDGGDIFQIELQGSSIGKKAVKDDTTGNVIGLSSSAVKDDEIVSFNVCLDAVVVIVNTKNDTVNDLTLAQLYDIFSGKIKKFSEL